MKVFKGDCGGILEAEKTSALSMHHKYILELIGCHNSCEDSAVLVYPFAERGSLDEYLTGKFLNQKISETSLGSGNSLCW